MYGFFLMRFKSSWRTSTSFAYPSSTERWSYEKFLAIMLTYTLELVVITLNRSLKIGGIDITIMTHPQLLQKSRKCLCDETSTSHHIIPVELSKSLHHPNSNHRLIFITQQQHYEFGNVGQTLQAITTKQHFKPVCQYSYSMCFQYSIVQFSPSS